MKHGTKLLEQPTAPLPEAECNHPGPSSAGARRVARLTPIVLVIAMGLPTVLALVYFLFAASWPGFLQRATWAASKLLQFGLPLAWFWLERQSGARPASAIGPRSKKAFVRGLCEGILFGLGVSAAMGVGYFVLGADMTWLRVAGKEIAQRLSGFGITLSWEYAAVGLGYSLVHSFLEEYYWRWFVYGWLRRWLRIPAAATVAALAFAGHHVVVLGLYFGFFTWAAWLMSAAVVLGGIYWALLYERSGSLIPPWISHIVIDIALFSVGYFLARPFFLGVD